MERKPDEEMKGANKQNIITSSLKNVDPQSLQ
jgi:hypothetical protein